MGARKHPSDSPYALLTTTGESKEEEEGAAQPPFWQDDRGYGAFQYILHGQADIEVEVMPTTLLDWTRLYRVHTGTVDYGGPKVPSGGSELVQPERKLLRIV